MKYYSAIKNLNNVTCSNEDRPRDHHTGEVSQEEKDKYNMISLICGI